ncbi:hypothetical protein GQ37_018190 [Janthinobacterium sp. BJB1]|nr:hypothetical protein GQ37_018190 [Janthinobacterium sp. BJB1]
MAALQLLAVLAYCLRRCALPSTFFRPAWPEEPVRATGVLIWFVDVLKAGRRRGPEKMPMAALQLLAVLAYCLRRCALPPTFFRPAWPGEPVRATGVLSWFVDVLLEQGQPGHASFPVSALFATLLTLISAQNLRQCSINFIG